MSLVQLGVLTLAREARVTWNSTRQQAARIGRLFSIRGTNSPGPHGSPAGLHSAPCRDETATGGGAVVPPSLSLVARCLQVGACCSLDLNRSSDYLINQRLLSVTSSQDAPSG